MEKCEIHIGQLIKKVVREKNIRDIDFADLIKKSRQNVYDLYKRNDVEVKLLLTISKALDYDFFQHFSVSKQDDKIKVFTEEENKKDSISILQVEYKQQISILTQTVLSQQQTIDYLCKKIQVDTVAGA